MFLFFSILQYDFFMWPYGQTDFGLRGLTQLELMETSREKLGEESTYYKCSNTDVGSTEQELINILEHKIY